ncbi:alpha/beta fold hydrolase [Staphylococcus equorum]|uniref:Alpha/beta hydrolase n=1 Tax=Staphylococcus equorum TaxID=246432 RepID=A0A9X4LH90_9STAP|nr:alpha/beta hydrolase [Staphylococcus equorum]MDG0860770.1 alpha/beta hydrolase [Staphylococcus equorum]
MTHKNTLYKDTIIFLPGTLCNEKLWNKQIEFFESEYNIIVGNLKNYNSIERMAEEILYKAPEKFFLVGLSLGGIVSLEIARIAPQRVIKLILMDTTPYLPTIKQMDSWRVFREMCENKQFDDITKKHILPQMLSDKNYSEELKNIVIEMSKDVGMKAYLNQLNALENRKDYRKFLNEISVKTLILVGEEDKICPVYISEYLDDQLPNSSLNLISNSGHLPPLENPDLTNNRINYFIKN